MNHSNLEALGWDRWFEEQARLRCGSEGAVARVAAVDRDQLLLLDETGAFRAKLSGKVMQPETGTDLFIDEEINLFRFRVS